MSRLAFPTAMLITLLTSQGQEVRAETSPIDSPVRISVIGDCPTPPFSLQELEDLLRAELTLARPSGSSVPTVVTIELQRCDDAPTVTLRVSREDEEPFAERSIELGEIEPDTRARSVALSIAELLSAIPPESPESAIESDAGGEVPTEAPPSEEATEAASEAPASPGTQPSETRSNVSTEDEETPWARPAPRRQRWALDIGLGTLSAPMIGSGLLGLRLGATIPLGRRAIALGFGGSGWYGGAKDPLGAIDLFSVLGSVGLMLHRRRQALQLDLGLWFDLGWLRGKGRPWEPTTGAGTADALLALVLLRFALRFRLTSRLWALAETFLGYTIRGLDGLADERSAGGIRGVVFGLGLGLSFSR